MRVIRSDIYVEMAEWVSGGQCKLSFDWLSESSLFIFTTVILGLVEPEILKFVSPCIDFFPTRSINGRNVESRWRYCGFI